MIKRFIFTYFLRDFRTYLSNIENICECELERLSYDIDEDLGLIYIYDDKIHEINIVKSWLTDYEYKLGIKK